MYQWKISLIYSSIVPYLQSFKKHHHNIALFQVQKCILERNFFLLIFIFNFSKNSQFTWINYHSRNGEILHTCDSGMWLKVVHLYPLTLFHSRPCLQRYVNRHATFSKKKNAVCIVSTVFIHITVHLQGCGREMVDTYNAFNMQRSNR